MSFRIIYLTDPYTKGAHVTAAQEKLHQNKYGRFLKSKANIDGVYGPVTARATRRAKYLLGYPRKRINGSYGEQLNAYLAGTKPLPAVYRLRRRRRLAAADKARTVRAEMVAQAMWATRREPLVHYEQSRPMPLSQFKRHVLPLRTDCSGFCTCIAYAAGAPDPNGRKFDGLGYTGTMLSACEHIARSEVKVGDYVVYGDGTGNHVCMVVAMDTDPLLVSHGQEAGPILIRHSAEHRAQGYAKVTWLSAGV